MNSPETTKKLAGSIADIQRQDAMRVLTDSERAVSGLDPAKDPTLRRKFPESAFREHFLPVVSGEAYKRLPPDYTPERLYDEAYNLWSQVAGGLTMEVEVIEPDGTVAFVVPALMDTSIMNIAQPSDRVGLRAANKEYIERSQGLPQVAKTQLQRSLNQQINHMFANPVDPKRSKEQVNKMRQYYNLPIEGSAAENTQTSQGFMGDLSFD